jgi:hypothetical protein
MPIGSGKRMTRAEALKILEIPEWASRDEIEAAYQSVKQPFQGKRTGWSKIHHLLNEAKCLLVHDVDPASAARRGRIALQLGSWKWEWLSGSNLKCARGIRRSNRRSSLRAFVRSDPAGYAAARSVAGSSGFRTNQQLMRSDRPI